MLLKWYTCLLMYEHISANKPCNLSISLASEQHNYSTQSASTHQLFVPHFRINIRTFYPTVIGKYYWKDFYLSVRSIVSKLLLKGAI